MPSTQVWIMDGRAVLADAVARPPASPSVDIPALAAVLSAGERTRLSGFLRPARAAEFLLGRFLLRHALAQALDCTADDIRVTERSGAAPLVLIGDRPADGITLPGVSLSHSRGWIACAVGETCQVGVDIEATAVRRDTHVLALSLFSPHEQAWLARQPRHDEAFHRLWCAKEALYKYHHNTGRRGMSGLPAVVHEPGLDASIGVADAHLLHRTEDEFYLSLCGPPDLDAQQFRLHQVNAGTLLNLSLA